MGLPESPPNKTHLLPSCVRDLEKILKKNAAEFTIIWEDLKRLGFGTLPSQGRKKLKGMDAFQMDSGRYRIVYSREGNNYLIWAVFAKPAQHAYLKALKKKI